MGRKEKQDSIIEKLICGRLIRISHYGMGGKGGCRRGIFTRSMLSGYETTGLAHLFVSARPGSVVCLSLSLQICGAGNSRQFLVGVLCR